MAIAFDSKTESPKSNMDAGSPASFSHTTAGSDRGLLVYYYYGITSGTHIVSATYNSVSMTLVSNTVDNSRGQAVFKLTNPASGSNTVAITYSGGTGVSDRYAVAVSYTGVDQTDFIEANATGTVGGGTAISISTTSLTDNALIVGSGSSRNNRTWTPDSPATAVWSQDNGTIGVQNFGASRTTTTAGSYAVEWTASGTDNGATAIVALKPAPAAATNTSDFFQMF